LIKTGGRTIHCEIHKLIISIWIKEELPEEWKESIILPIYKKGDKTDCSNYKGISLFANYVQNFIQHPAVKLTPYARKLLGIISVDFDAAGQLLIIDSAFVKYLRKNGNAMKQCISSS